MPNRFTWGALTTTAAYTFFNMNPETPKPFVYGLAFIDGVSFAELCTVIQNDYKVAVGELPILASSLASIANILLKLVLQSSFEMDENSAAFTAGVGLFVTSYSIEKLAAYCFRADEKENNSGIKKTL